MQAQPLSILIIEDERLVAMDLSARLQHAGYTIVGTADNYTDATALFRKKLPDLVLLDITIKGDKTGIDVAHEINKILPTPFIYLTAHSDAATLQRAKATFPAAYLLKPFTTSHLLVSVELALHNFAYQKTGSADSLTQRDSEDDIYLKQGAIFIKDGHKFIKLHYDDILYMEANDNYVKFYTTEKNYLVRCTLAKAIEKLQQDRFVRVHRSYALNIDKVDGFSDAEVTINNTQLPIGGNYKSEFIERFKLL